MSINFPLIIVLQLLENAIKRVQVGQDGLKLNVSHHLLVYADGSNLLGGNIRYKEKYESFTCR
jgi:hypothetical protein